MIFPVETWKDALRTALGKGIVTATSSASIRTFVFREALFTSEDNDRIRTVTMKRAEYSTSVVVVVPSPLLLLCGLKMFHWEWHSSGGEKFAFRSALIEYLMSSKFPSGGTKLTIFSRSKRPYRTHGWKEQSSISFGSLKLSNRSGIPLSRQSHWIRPETSDWTTFPEAASMIASISSMTSMYISFCVWVTPDALQGMLLIVPLGSACETLLFTKTAEESWVRIEGGRIIALRALGSVVSGQP
mmetsp:Transcript_29615/g.63476  ORF Transcript_29615/g.63476 Transcript_29615/m.63476 type:complete len:243 (-) Transcript_29615:322-1050(-)